MSESRYKEAISNHLLAVSVALGDANNQRDLALRLGDSEREARKVRATALMEALHRQRRPEG